jgi:hypothetical protein
LIVHAATPEDATAAANQGGVFVSRIVALDEAAGGDRLTCREKWALGLGLGGAVALLLIFLAYFFVLRDTWEEDNRAAIASLLNSATTLEARGELSHAASKCDDLLHLTAGRQLRDADLVIDVQRARELLSRLQGQLRSVVPDEEPRSRDKIPQATQLVRSDEKMGQEESKQPRGAEATAGASSQLQSLFMKAVDYYLWSQTRPRVANQFQEEQLDQEKLRLEHLLRDPQNAVGWDFLVHKIDYTGSKPPWAAGRPSEIRLTGSLALGSLATAVFIDQGGKFSKQVQNLDLPATAVVGGRYTGRYEVVRDGNVAAITLYFQLTQFRVDGAALHRMVAAPGKPAPATPEESGSP